MHHLYAKTERLWSWQTISFISGSDCHDAKGTQGKADCKSRRLSHQDGRPALISKRCRRMATTEYGQILPPALRRPRTCSRGPPALVSAVPSPVATLRWTHAVPFRSLAPPANRRALPPADRLLRERLRKSQNSAAIYNDINVAAEGLPFEASVTENRAACLVVLSSLPTQDN